MNTALTLMIGITTDLIAARYSASPSGLELLDQAMLTVLPSPPSTPEL